MKITPQFPILAAFALSWVSFAMAADPGGAKRESASAVAVDNRSTPAPPVIDAGMPAAEIERLLGRPAEIKLIETPEGKAETWIYRRQIGKQTTQDAVAQSYVPAFNGLATSMGTTPQFEYRLKFTTTYQVTSLLIYEGKLIKAKQSRAEVISYDR